MTLLTVLVVGARGLGVYLLSELSDLNDPPRTRKKFDPEKELATRFTLAGAALTAVEALRIFPLIYFWFAPKRWLRPAKY